MYQTLDLARYTALAIVFIIAASSLIFGDDSRHDVLVNFVGPSSYELDSTSVEYRMILTTGE